MVVVRVRHPDEGEDDGALAFLVVDADAFSTEPDGGEVVFRRADEVVLAVPESEYLGHWGPSNSLE